MTHRPLARDAAPIPIVLVADDEPVNLHLIQMIVEVARLAVRLVTAANGEEALVRARELRPDLILMDLKMPGLDGWETTRRLKADPATAGIPVIALTAQAMPGDDAQATAAGCEGYITKPIDVHAFVAMLKDRLA